MCETRSIQAELPTLEKSIFLDDLKRYVPKPKGATPNFGLPKWKTLPLDSKIPMIPGIQEFVMSRRKVGESLRVPFEDRKRVDTSDPYNYETPLPYDGLHDPHLTRFYREAINLQKFMIKTGLITPELDVKCNLSEYNSYRKYLRMMHGKFIRRELERRDEIQKEKMMLEITERLALTKYEKLRKYEKIGEILAAIDKKRKEFCQLIMYKDRQDTKKVKALEFAKKQMNLKKKLQARIKREYKKEKLAMLAKKDQQYTLNLLKHMHEREARLKVFFEQAQLNRERAKMEASVSKYENKKKSQLESMEREAQLKECAEMMKQKFIEEYQRRIDCSRQQLHELYLKKRKALKFRIKPREKFEPETDCRCLVIKKEKPRKPIGKNENQGC